MSRRPILRAPRGGRRRMPLASWSIKKRDGDGLPLLLIIPAVLEATATSVLDGIICLQPQRPYLPTNVELDSIQYYERTLRARS